MGLYEFVVYYDGNEMKNDTICIEKFGEMCKIGVVINDFFA